MFVTNDDRCPPVKFYLDRFEGELPFELDKLSDYMTVDVDGTFILANFK